MEGDNDFQRQPGPQLESSTPSSSSLTFCWVFVIHFPDGEAFCPPEGDPGWLSRLSLSLLFDRSCHGIQLDHRLSPFELAAVFFDVCVVSLVAGERLVRWDLVDMVCAALPGCLFGKKWGRLVVIVGCKRP